MRGDLLNLREHRRQESLGSRAGIDAHHQDQVHQVPHVLQDSGGGGRVQGYARHRSETADLLEHPVQVHYSLGVNCDTAGAGPGKGPQQTLRVVHHKVRIQDQGGAGAQRFRHQGAGGQCRNEVAVHNIQVNPIGPPLLHPAHLFPQAREIGG